MGRFLIALFFPLFLHPSTASADNTTGSSEAMELAGESAEIASRVTEENQQQSESRDSLADEYSMLRRRIAEIEAERARQTEAERSSDCAQEDATHEDDGEGPYLNVQIQAYVVSGFEQGGERVEYEEARFGDLEVFDRRFVRWMALSDARAAYSRDREKFHDFLMAKIINSTASERLRLLREAGELMNFDEQVEFISRVGGLLNRNYDRDRARETVSGTGEVSCQEMFDALASGDDAGVCRDIHMCMADMLVGMGNEGNVYGISYATPGNYHVSIVATDPDNPKRIHNINYDDNNVSSRRNGIASLSQEHGLPDVGITYRLWEPDGQGGGRMVSALPSQVGLLLNQMTGGNNQRDFDPNIRNDYNQVNAEGGIGPWSARAFAATLDNGDRVLGVATRVELEDQSTDHGAVFDGINHNGSVAVSFAHRIMDRGRGARDQTQLNMIYLAVRQHFEAPIQFTDEFSLVPDSSFRLHATAIEGGGGTYPWTGDGDAAWTVGGELRYRSTNGDHQVSLGVHNQTTAGLADVRGLLGSDIIVTPNHTAINFDSRTQLDPRVALNTSLLFTERQIGDTFRATAGLDITSDVGRTSLLAGIQTPVGRSNGFVPGGAHPSLLIGLGQTIVTDDNDNPLLDINASYIQNLDDGNFNITTGATLHLD